MIKELTKLGDTIAARDARIRELETALAERWVPIETAPRDGTRILAIDEDKVHYVVAWMVNYYIVYPTNKQKTKKMKAWCVPESYQDEQGDYFTVEATHWTPLPEPPTQEKVDE